MADAALSDSPLPVEPEVVPGDVVEVVVPGAVVVDGLAPGVALPGEPGRVLAPEPGAGVDPEVPELLGRAGVVPTGLGVGAGGLLDELDDGLGFGDGFGVLELGAGGGLLGAPPDPNANPMTLPEGGA